MTASLATPIDPHLLTLAKAKLATEFFRGGELDRITRLLDRDEHVVTLGDALCRSGAQTRRGLIVLTDERLICLDTGSRHTPLLELRLAEVTSVEIGLAQGSGDARRGELTILAGGIKTHLGRVRPWACAAEIAEHIRVQRCFSNTSR